MRIVALSASAIVLIPIGLYFAILAGLTLLQQLLATLLDFGNASWTAWMSPPVLLGIQSPSGGGGIFDALVGGPNSPGGTVGRFIVFAISAAIAYGCWAALVSMWAWVRKPAVESG